MLGRWLGIPFIVDFQLKEFCDHGQRPEAEANKKALLLSLLSSRSHHLTDALTEHDSENGLTVLGLAVAWGHENTVEMLASTCRYEAFSAPLHLTLLACPLVWKRGAVFLGAVL